ncbi:MAG: hypothetical protein FJ146_10965 [Deltaproteobacteria bacterium]|nr:hypothetical protein [Deltaproteobacteria bacterium]
MHMTAANPQNPYASFLVAASAGSGKTFQLSQRFLHLVSAGASPASVLTVTFTKKAAGEMRARILAEAADLLAKPEKQRSFDERMRQFYDASSGGKRRPPPIPAAELAPRLLASSQLLRISTIDSLFLEWVSKFPFEARPDASPDERSGGPTTLLDPDSSQKLDAQAWRATGELLMRALTKGEPWADDLLSSVPDGGVLALQRYLGALDRQDTYVWYSERLAAARGGAFIPWIDTVADPSEAQLMATITDAMRAVALSISNEVRRQAVLEALAAADFGALLATELLTKADLKISARYIKGAKRDALLQPISVVETAVRQHVDERQLIHLTRIGTSHYQLYRIYRALRENLKHQSGALEFRDLVKGGFELLHGAASAGARFLLAHTIQHVLLDEFQDTSRLQWAVFDELITPMLAGEGIDSTNGLAPSVFIVGDSKQSIYGFREADPAVMDDARTKLSASLRDAPLTASFRTAQVVLDYVNAVFRQDESFPPHHTAAVDDKLWVPDDGCVLVLPLVTVAKDSDLEPAMVEADMLAATLAEILATGHEYPVFDKASGGYRPLVASDCCILYRSSTHAAIVEAALRRRSVACQREEERGFFARTEVRDLAALLRFLALPTDLVALATVLRSPIGGVSDAAMLPLIAQFKGQELAGDRITAQLEAQGFAVATTLKKLRRLAGRMLPHELLLEALRQLGAFAAYSHPSLYQDEDADLARRNLVRLVELVMMLEDQDLVNLVPLVERLEDMAQSDDFGNAAGRRCGVTLMTIHKAKGLEFPLVAVMDTGRPWGQRDSYWAQGVDDEQSPGLYYVGTSTEQPQADAQFRQVLEATETSVGAECERLLYVALTRARQYLLISGHAPARIKGLASTVVYPRLAEAIHHGPDSRTTRPYRWRQANQTSAASGAAAAAAAELLSYQETSHWSSVAAALTLAGPDVRRSNSDRLTSTLDQLVARTDVPREVTIVAPSRHEADRGASATTRLPLRLEAQMEPKMAALVGTLTHRALEAYMNGSQFDSMAAWQTLLGHVKTWAKWRDAILSEVAAITEDPWITALRSSTVRLATELPVVYKRGAELVTGSLDLLAETTPGRFLVVDYKTTRFATPGDSASLTDTVLEAFCSERGYLEQVRTYGTAVRALYPEAAEIRACIYFTQIRRPLAVNLEFRI